MGRPQGDNLSDEINEAVMRSVIKNLRALIANPDDDFARGELMWDSALAENGLPELGKQTDFQCHMLEHAVGAYTDCNHGQGLAVIHPALYRHLLAEGKEKLARMAERVWGVKGDTVEQTATLGIKRHRSLHPRDRHAHPLERNGHHGRGCPSCRCRHLPADARLLQAVYEGRTVRSVKRKYVIKS